LRNDSHTNATTTDDYYQVLEHRLADNAARTKPLSNSDDFDDFDGGSPGFGCDKTSQAIEIAPQEKRDDPARTRMVRFAVSQNTNQNSTSLIIMQEYTRRHVHVTSLDLT
jgi:hypothetical protein